MASMIADSEGLAATSPEGVQLVCAAPSCGPTGMGPSLTACLRCSVHRRDQRMPGQSGAFHAGGKFVHPRKRGQLLEFFSFLFRTLGADAAAHHGAEFLK